MRAIPVTRIKDGGFDVYLNTYTSSMTSTADSASLSASMGSTVSISNGISQTIVNNAGWGSSSFEDDAAQITSNQMEIGAGGSTYYQDATMTSYSTSSSQSSSMASSQNFGTGPGSSSFTTLETNSVSTFSSDSFTQQYIAEYETTTETDWTSTINTSTATTSDTTSYDIVSGALTTVTATCDVTTATQVTTDTTTMTYTVLTGSYDTYIEYGNELQTDATDWLWKVTAENMTPTFISAIASTINGTTQWADTFAVAEDIQTADTDASSSTVTIPGFTSSLTYNDWNIDLSETVTYTSGISLSRATVTTTVPSYRTTTQSVSYGQDSSTVYGIGITEDSTLTTVYDTIAQTVLYPKGYSNYSTSEIVGLTSYVTSTTTATVVDWYSPSFSSSVDGATTEGGATVLATNVFQRATVTFGFSNGGGAITPIAPFGAFLPDSALRSAGDLYQFATNVEIAGTRIPYWWSNSVFSNAQTPAPFANSTTGTNSHTWLYLWSAHTLKITEQMTSLSGTHTVTSSTVTSGVFSAMGTDTRYYTDGGTAWGGFPAIPTAADSVYFPPRAVEGTSISVGGASSTYRVIVTSSASTQLSENILVENTIPNMAVVTTAGTDQANAILFYTRNQNG